MNILILRKLYLHSVYSEELGIFVKTSETHNEITPSMYEAICYA